MRKNPRHSAFICAKAYLPTIRSSRVWIAAAIVVLVAAQLACRAILGAPTPDPLKATIAALKVQQTHLAATLEAFTAVAQPGGTSQIAQSTLDASLATASAQAGLLGTLSSPPQATLPVTPSPKGTVDERTLKSAKILLFEDMSASRYIRIAKQALDEDGYFYQDVGSAKGWFKTQLLSPVKWDLIIAAAEADRQFGGEFYAYLSQRLKDGAAVILETWDLDQAPGGLAGELLASCGVRFEADWYEPQPRAFFWLQPQNPIFHVPNEIPGFLPSAPAIWPGDHGDQLMLDPRLPESEANPILLAGTNTQIKDRHALLVSCLGGRMIIQTFRTHEYQYDAMLSLWKNYIYNALSSYYSQDGQAPPTPARTAIAPQPETPTPHGPTPGPGYTLAHGCDGLFAVRFTDAPRFQTELFEHHAAGEYMLLHLSLQNQADFPLMIWANDYALEGKIGERAVVYTPDPAASGYLYVEGGFHLRQDVIQPGESWRVALAFDIDPQASDLALVFRPGSEFNETACEARIPANR